MEQVILVSENDDAIGTMEKMEAHRRGVLHRAFSVFIFDQHGRMLLQQRALHKYHSGGLWTNACCSHPRPGEETATAASRRLKEELGFQANLQPMFQFTYKAEFENGLTEYEFDHVFFGMYEGDINPNENEVMDFKYETVENIAEQITQQPVNFTAWFRIAFPGVQEWFKSNVHLFSSI
jgi:isopentenyl-diphosphate delta-isomerase